MFKNRAFKLLFSYKFDTKKIPPWFVPIQGGISLSQNHLIPNIMVLLG